MAVFSVPVISTSQQFSDQPTANTGVLRDNTGGVTHVNVTASGTMTAGGALIVAVVSKTANYAVGTTDHIILANATGGALNITLPTPAGNTGRVIRVKKTDSSGNAVTVLHNGSETIDGASSIALSAQYNYVTLICDGTNWQVFT